MTQQPSSEQRTVRFSGRVQGVGFRHTTATLAQKFAVTGTVENLDDGDVLLVVEGEKPEVEAFCQEIDRAMGRNIVERKVDRRPATGRFERFRVKH